MKIPQFEVLEGFERTQVWLGHITDASDSHRHELGFLPRSVFEQFARKSELFVLVERRSDDVKYAGHLLFDCRFPRAHIRQMFTLDLYRRQGAASLLLQRLRSFLTERCFISIYARVAEDLRAANEFWQHQGFYVQRCEKGGASRNRQILVRCYELDSPQLFAKSGQSAHNPLGLMEYAHGNLPMYLLDMNVLFDVQPRRFRRVEVVSLLQAERMNFCRLAISDEVRNELRRSLHGRDTDPMAAYIETFPCLPVVDNEFLKSTLDRLSALVFPASPKDSHLDENSRSDLRHLLTAIQHDLAGLVTSDGALLRAASAIEREFRIRIYSPAVFLVGEEHSHCSAAFETVTRSTLRVSSVGREDEAGVRRMLSEKARLTGSAIASAWLPIETSFRIAVRNAIWSDRLCVGYVTWPGHTSAGTVVVARAVVDESHPQALDAARILLLQLLESLCRAGPCQLVLELASRQSYLREVGASLGFTGEPSSSRLVKSSLGMVLTAHDWPKATEAFAACGGLRLSSELPKYMGPDQQLALLTANGDRVFVTLDRLESLLAPAILCLPGRPAIISPLRRQYAEPLLGHAKQISLLPLTSASLHASKFYLCQPASLKHFKRGTVVLFYESGKRSGRSQVVALARVREAYLRSRSCLTELDLEQSVLNKDRLNDLGKSDLKCVAVFDNVFQFPHPVDLSCLKQLGCGRPTDLITTNQISDTQLAEILRRGFQHD